VGAACHTGARTCFDEGVLLKDADSGASGPDQ
jgi:phosphoribosyl-AMP cyclohydrolase